MTVIIIYVLYGYLETFGHWIFQSVEEEQQGRTARNETHPSLRNILQRAKNYCGRSQSSLRITFDHDLSLRFEMAFCIKQNYIMFNFRAQAHNGKTTLMQYCIIDFVIVRQMENGQQSVKKKTKMQWKMSFENYCPFWMHCVARQIRIVGGVSLFSSGSDWHLHKDTIT